METDKSTRVFSTTPTLLANRRDLEMPAASKTMLTGAVGIAIIVGLFFIGGAATWLLQGDSMGADTGATKTASARAGRAGNISGSAAKGKPIGKSVVICVFNILPQSYERIRLGSSCDMTLFPFYSERRNDTFHDDSHPVTRLLLDMAARARGGNFGLHLPQRKAERIQEDLREDKAHRAMQSYWVFNNIRSYAVLDLEVRSLAYGVSTTVATTFGLLKVLRQQMDIYEGESGYKTRGYLVLGVRPWARTNDALFTELEKQLKSFPVDALVVRTHLFEDELASSYKNCRSTSPTPYEVRHSDYIMGLAATADYVSSRTWLVQRYSVAVSFSLCSRWYDTHPVFKLGRRCKPPGWTGVPISLACSIKERDYFANLTFDRREHSMYSWSDKRWMIALDTMETMKWKICQTVKRHSSVSFGIALFDVECEDWARECTTPSQAPFRGAPRLREVSRFFRREVTPTAGRDLPCQ